MKCFASFALFRSLPKACGVLFACAFMFKAPEPTFAQHGGGGGHSGGHFNGEHFGGGHFGGGRGHHSARPLVGAGTHNSGIARLRGIDAARSFLTTNCKLESICS